jgi:hypothetical protein
MRTSLVVTPTDTTRSRLAEMIASSILTLDFDLMNIELAAIEGNIDWTPEPMTVYDDVRVKELTTNGTFFGAGVVNSLVAYVESAKLSARAHLLGQRMNQFKWVLKYDLQPGRSTRLAITTLTDVLVYREAPFSFSDEMLLLV